MMISPDTPEDKEPALITNWRMNGYGFASKLVDVEGKDLDELVDAWDRAQQHQPPITRAALLAMPSGVEVAREIYVQGWMCHWSLNSHDTQVQQNVDNQTATAKRYAASALNAPKATKRVRAFINLPLGTAVYWSKECEFHIVSTATGNVLHREKYAVEIVTLEATRGRVNGSPLLVDLDALVIDIAKLKTDEPVTVELDHWGEEVEGD